MNSIVKALIFLYLIIELVIGDVLPYEQLFILMIIIAVNILKERFWATSYLSIVTLLLTIVVSTMDIRFSVLFAMASYDFTLKKQYIGTILTFFCAIYYLGDQLSSLLMFIFVSLLAYVIGEKKESSIHYSEVLDNERRLRYELEQTKARLLHSSKEIAAIVEIKERNRIARDIHDSIGHNLAGILIQLQAAYKLHTKNQEKSLEIVQNSITGLAKSLELLRNTVHNIKPRETLGVEYIENIIKQFTYCPVDLKLSGNFNTVPPSHLELISTNIKEALTNTARYSGATRVTVNVDVTNEYTRLFIKDNGVGCGSIKEGLGLSGMKERVRNVGGTTSISAKDGFLIVCMIPREEGSKVFETINR
ncbi:sensor histidine kinase [Pseudoneobacillus sp. C159]